jgi:hypothetical protein
MGIRSKAVVAAATLALAGVCTPSYGADTFPSQDSCHVTNNNTPVGNCGPFTQLYHDSFSTTLAVGKVSGCAGDGNFLCSGLTGTPYAATLGAYPDGWPDTATQRGYAQGGYYRPQSTISVVQQSSSDGQLEVKMTSDGTVNKVAAVVPRSCMNLRYGKFSERFIVRTRTAGFKTVPLHYGPKGEEVDYPEAGGDFSQDPISVFTHGFTESATDVAPNNSWTSWHTYTQERVPGQIRFYLDGSLVKTLNSDYPVATDWILQSESALNNQRAAAGSSVTIDTTWVACYKYTG